MSWFRKKSAYTSLPVSEGSVAESDSEVHSFLDKDQDFIIETQPREGYGRKYITIALAITGVLSIANLAFFLSQYLQHGFHKSPSSKPDAELELASAYIGLDKIQITESYQIDNMPLAVGYVDQKHPDTVCHDETPHWLTLQGTVIPERRHIMLNEAISTIVQFRTFDYGLEICRPTIILPTVSSLIEANSTVKSENNKPRTFNISATPSSSVPVHVWALDTTDPDTGRERELDFRKLTFSNKPVRRMYLGTMDAQEGHTVSADWFSCRSGSLHALELSCNSPGCFVDFWTDTEQPKMAFVVIQSSSTAQEDGQVID